MSLSRKVFGSSKTDAPRVDINIVPLVDVSLVLLIIFMVTATFIKNSAMRLDLPSASATGAPPPIRHEIVVEVDRAGEIAFNGAPIAVSALDEAFKNEADLDGTDGRVTVRGDSQASYGAIVHVMSVARDAGFVHLLVATKPDGGGHDVK